MADRLYKAGNHFGVSGMFDGFLFQVVQKLFDLLFNLPRCPQLAVLINGFKQARQFDHPGTLPFQLSIRGGIALADSRDAQQAGQEGMPPFFSQRRKDVARRCRPS